MLKKLLKYDLRAVFKFWWIAVVISFSLSVTGGFAAKIESYDGWLPEILSAMTGILIFLAYCSYIALFIMTLVLLFVRFYKNFFSDEGYLTFTLPVSRAQLLNSKVITGIGAMVATVLVCILNYSVMCLIEEWTHVLDGTLWNSVTDYFVKGIQTQGMLFWVYAAEAVTLVLIISTLVVLFLYFCICFGSMIVKKGKLFASVAIFYGASSIFISVSQFLVLFGYFGLFIAITPESIQELEPIVSLFLLELIFFLATLASLFYALQYRMLDKKLNLS